MPGTYEVTFHTVKNGVPFQNQIFVATDAADGTFSEALEVVSSVTGSTVTTAFLDCLPSDVTLEAISARSVVMVGGSATPSATAVGMVGSAGTRIPGAGTGQTSNQSGPIISYLPDINPGERARVCKLFIPTINESDAEDDQIGNAISTAMGLFVAALGSILPVASGPVAWIARIKKFVGPDLVSYARAIVSAAGEEFIASQRNRRPRRI